MTLKYKSAGILTAGILSTFAINLDGTFFYPVVSVAAEVAGTYEVYRTGKTDARNMDILYKGTFSAVTPGTEVNATAGGRAVTVSSGAVSNGSS
jgi:hypothetical protein